jgi:broad specificity phosphatase PhoE
MPTILLIRHAQASFGGENYDLLSELGRRQAEVLGAALGRRNLKLGRVVTGSGKRHRETAAPLLVGTGGEALVDPRWDEYGINEVLSHHGGSAARVDLQGGAGPTPAREFRDALVRALDEWVAAGPASPCEPTWPQYTARGTAAFEQLAEQLRPGETAAVFTSAGVIAVIAAALLDLPPERFSELSRVAVNTAITKVIRGAGGSTLVSFNEHSHLEAVDRSLVTYQ